MSQHSEEIDVGRKRRIREQAVLPDGYYWFKSFINLDGGGHVDEWKLAQIVVGKFRRIGSTAEWEQGCDYLRNALWVRLDPPPSEAGDTTAIRTATELRRDARVGRASRDDDYRARQRALIVAEGVVAAFTELHDSTAAYYARRPEQRAELVGEIARLIGRVRE
jgi:hypothetical protein